MNTIKKISSNFSIGVQNEIDALGKFKEGQYGMLDAVNANEYIYNLRTSSTAVREYSALLVHLPKGPLKILDLGVGLGQSSIYLASLGHEVYSLEPNGVYCDIIHKAAIKFNYDKVQVIEGVSEDILNINEFDFDVVFFNASLHHCDDPDKALNNAYTLLKEGGMVVLASENFLRPWISKKKWYYLLNNFPEKMGHYGGNEHVYYNWEYANFLKKAKFKNIKRFPSAYETTPIERLEHILGKRINGVRMYNENKLLIRFIFYIISAKLMRGKFFFSLLSKASIVQAHFVAVK